MNWYTRCMSDAQWRELSEDEARDVGNYMRECPVLAEALGLRLAVVEIERCGPIEALTGSES